MIDPNTNLEVGVTIRTLKVSFCALRLYPDVSVRTLSIPLYNGQSIYKGIVAIKPLLNVVKQGSVNKEWGGWGIIRGTVKKKQSPKNIPMARQVSLLRNKFVIIRTISDKVTGEYEFKYLSLTGDYILLTTDYENEFKPAALSNVIPVAIDGF